MIVKSIKNPVIKSMGVCDPHLQVFEEKIYMYCSHDYSVENTTYRMDDWHVWSTVDFREWTLEQIVKPEDFYMGKSSNCWALDAAEKDGKYYLYFSNKNDDTGVAVSDSPSGPFVDVMKKPLLDGTNTPTREYDPAILRDDDGNDYIVFGAPAWAYGEGGYYIAKLGDDMMSLAEVPKKIELDHEADDKVSLNKINGTYYLTWGSYYAISDSPYGPYTCIGNTGASEDHGSFIEHNGQIFHSFTIFDPTMVARSSGICYVHQKENKELVVDPLILEYGVGHYDTQWNKIHSQWFMKSEGMEKRDNRRYGFDMCTSGKGTLWYPNLENSTDKTHISFFASCDCEAGGVIEVRECEGGEVIGSVEIRKTGDLWRSYRIFTCELSKSIEDLHLTLSVNGKGEIRLDYFMFYTKGECYE